MKFSVGDAVLLKQTGEEGRVVAIMGDNMVQVEVSGTFFPVFVNDLEHPYLKWFTKKKQEEKASKVAEEMPVKASDLPRLDGSLTAGFYLVFQPVFEYDGFEDVLQKLKVYFANRSPYELKLTYKCLSGQGVLFSNLVRAGAYAQVYLHDIRFVDIQDRPKFEWNLERSGMQVQAMIMGDVLHIKPQKLFEHISSIRMENRPWFSLKLAEGFPEPPDEEWSNRKKIPRQLEMKGTSGKSDSGAIKRPRLRRVDELDLHIENLVDDPVGMSNFEMLSTQLDTFMEALDRAIALGQQSMIVIHGVGKGKLKEEIHKYLERRPEVDFFQQEWSPKYGYGATEIFFRQ